MRFGRIADFNYGQIMVTLFANVYSLHISLFSLFEVLNDVFNIKSVNGKYLTWYLR